MFQSPIGTQKTRQGEVKTERHINVSIPYRYTKNTITFPQASSGYVCFNPLQVHKKLHCIQIMKLNYQTCFNPLQVHKKHAHKGIRRNKSLKFQSPIGTQKTPQHLQGNGGYVLFQSPIGTQKTWHCHTICRWKGRVSIPYRYTKN